ncbi:VOC family protein [Altericroceibacterium spongiae]|uniref:VOC family protein n=1 Tax=Altericroceibacterium spongiae TaxID=2320269 RepID=A0A420EJW4_9SPHN|nr:VOC family protein [Altericroceibacterium spongiae]RKF21012.1 VOC family protein [Altericroceibacterium spongiae]
MATARLEHVNLRVSDIERSAALFEKLCGWHQRWRGAAIHGGETIHCGEQETYLALYSKNESLERFKKGEPLMHVGIVVDDLDHAESVVSDAGLLPFNHGDYEPGRRFYFLDWDGIEFEVVSYE